MIVRTLLVLLLALPAAAEETPGRRCSSDGMLCIRLDTYIPDTCRMIETAAEAAELDTAFFARLIWKESLFDAAAVSHAGAQGIAQFMPGTAALRGLEDPFNPVQALDASATYLAELSARFGNIGLAAVAYNGGEDRAARFIAGNGGLPFETRDYVFSITGHSAETWRDEPPESVDLRLDGETPFGEACVELAANRTLREFAAPVRAWGVVVAAQRTHGAARRSYDRVQRQHPGLLSAESPAIIRTRPPGSPVPRYTAQIGRDSRSEALAVCNQLRSAGGTCLVMRN